MKLAAYKLIAKDVQRDLAEALKKHGLELRRLGGRIDEHFGTVKITLEARDVNLKTADGSTTTPEQLRWKELAALYGLKPEWLGKQFKNGRSTYIVDGLRNGRAERNVLVKEVTTQKTYVMRPDEVKARFALQESTPGKLLLSA